MVLSDVCTSLFVCLFVGRCCCCCFDLWPSPPCLSVWVGAPTGCPFTLICLSAVKYHNMLLCWFSPCCYMYSAGVCFLHRRYAALCLCPCSEWQKGACRLGLTCSLLSLQRRLILLCQALSPSSVCNCLWSTSVTFSEFTDFKCARMTFF